MTRNGKSSPRLDLFQAWRDEKPEPKGPQILSGVAHGCLIGAKYKELGR